MATVPTPRTWAVGELLTAAKLNTDLRDGLNVLLAPPLAVLTQTTGTACPTSPASTVLNFQSEDIDRDGGHSTSVNISRYTAQTAGWYRLSTVFGWAGSNAYIHGRHRKNGSTELPGASFNVNVGSTGLRFPVAGVTFLAVSDYVETLVYQESGVTQTTIPIYTRFEIAWIST